MRLTIAEYRSFIKPKMKRNIEKRPMIRKQAPSEGEKILMRDLKALGIGFEHEYQFHSTRKWRADFLISNTKILVEVEGGIWSKGRHTRGSGYIGDMEKYNAAAILGFQVLRFSTQQVKSGLAIQQLEQLVGDSK